MIQTVCMHPLPLRLLAACTLLFSATAIAGEPPAAAGCADCHGKNGASTEADVPTIAGQSAAYFESTMIDYRDGKRPCPESKYRAGDTARAPTDMCKIAKALSEAEIAGLAKHFAALQFVPAKQPFDAAKVAAGKKIHELHCDKCHSEGGRSPDDDSGILAGQWIPYLENSLDEFKDGSRTMPKKMKPKIDALSAGDGHALLQYYASQQ